MKIDFKDPNNWIPREFFAAYCGEKSEELLSFYDESMEKEKTNRPSFDWFAILLSPVWFAYRRQWEILILIAILTSIHPIIDIIFTFFIPAGISSKFIIPVCFGFFAHSILLKNAQIEFTKLKQNSLNDNEIKQQLENKATPSVLYAVLAGLGWIVIIYLSKLFIYKIFYFYF